MDQLPQQSARGVCCSPLNQVTMLFKSQKTDRLIQGIRSIQMNRCSLSDEDLNLLEEVAVLLTEHDGKWNRNDTATVVMIVKVSELLIKFFGQ